jgi:hypothetical protein
MHTVFNRSGSAIWTGLAPGSRWATGESLRPCPPAVAPRARDVGSKKAVDELFALGVLRNTLQAITEGAAGNVPLVEALLARGANPELTDPLVRNALQWSLLEAFRDVGFAKGPFAELHELIAPAAVDVMSGERLVRIDGHLSEYFLFQTLWALFKSRFSTHIWRERGGFETAAILEAREHLPPNVLRPERNK